MILFLYKYLIFYKSRKSLLDYFYIDLDQPDARNVMNGVGLVMLGIYSGFMIIILINMLIAMMSHSFEVIQVDK